MNVTDPSARPEVASAPRLAPRRRVPAARWLRVALVCMALAGSGGIRWWQAGRVGARLEQGRTSPFPLSELPMTLGSWRGADATLDPQIARHTGASDVVSRRYVDHSTGASVEVIVLYGPPVAMSLHVPEVCYPSAGYDRTEGPDQRAITVGKTRAPFRSLVFTKGEGGQRELQEVFYSWRYQDRWTSRTLSRKLFERIPGMYKVQVARLLADQERRDVEGPCESFLGALIPEIERRLATRPASAPAPRESVAILQ